MMDYYRQVGEKKKFTNKTNAAAMLIITVFQYPLAHDDANTN